MLKPQRRTEITSLLRGAIERLGLSPDNERIVTAALPAIVEEVIKLQIDAVREEKSRTKSRQE